MRSSLSWSGSTRPSASSVVTTIGKKQTSAMIASFGTIPKPNQTTSSGAMITIGTVWERDEQRVRARGAA